MFSIDQYGYQRNRKASTELTQEIIQPPLQYQVSGCAISRFYAVMQLIDCIREPVALEYQQSSHFGNSHMPLKYQYLLSSEKRGVQ